PSTCSKLMKAAASVANSCVEGTNTRLQQFRRTTRWLTLTQSRERVLPAQVSSSTKFQILPDPASLRGTIANTGAASPILDSVLEQTLSLAGRAGPMHTTLHCTSRR